MFKPDGPPMGAAVGRGSGESRARVGREPGEGRASIGRTSVERQFALVCLLILAIDTALKSQWDFGGRSEEVTEEVEKKAKRVEEKQLKRKLKL